MCRQCFSPSLKNSLRTFDPDDPQPNQVTHAADQNLSRKERLSFPRRA